MFEGIGNLFNAMSSLRDLKAKTQELQKRLAQTTVVGAAGGDLVRVTVAAPSQIQAVEIDPVLLDDPDREMLQELIVLATNQALEKAGHAVAQVVGEMGFPGMPGMPDLNSILDSAASGHDDDDDAPPHTGNASRSSSS